MSLSPYTLLLLKSPLKQKYVQNVHYLQRSLQPVWQWLPAL
ncbi:hypothetical protein HmCmsJML164_02702 [Escherichia coli]|nr:hypothetical protein HmCmsJML164_02702 [Escherichia coli]